MKIAKKEYLQINQDYLKELRERKEKKANSKDIDYVSNNAFYCKERDVKDGLMEAQKGVKLIHLTSPSARCTSKTKNKAKDWREKLEQAGMKF
ncbi:hypothetical protein BBW65_07185 [Helicobacter enhydrae]|uniref:Uncharacterized protein n=1 Tax=Helicobacter enhydrae TaxID=222136 RepID=A0A1B1U777_9HELI|nr:hypothetical protein [Helicobacter enhydrae]ANV98590.1 hypothetical protein BBW65_07185 [Helicobacter enhydrae]